MFKINKSAAGGNGKYLTDAERAHSNVDEIKLSNEFSSTSKIQNIENFTEYLNQNNPHYQAKFQGELAKKWGAKYSNEQFTQLLIGECPEEFRHQVSNLRSGKNLTNIQNKRQSSTDMLSAPPKSVSIHFAISDKSTRDKIYNSMAKADEKLFKVLAKQIKPSCKKGEYQNNYNPTKTKLFIASFTHYEDRGLDPHLHNHHSLMNFAEFTFEEEQADGTIKEFTKILAVDPEEMFKRQLENSAVYDTLLEKELRLNGFNTELAKSEQGFETFRLAGYTREQELSLSKRGIEIKDYVEEQKKNGNFFSSTTQAEASYIEAIGRNTRDKKHLHSTEEILKIIKMESLKYLTKGDLKNIEQQQSIRKPTQESNIKSVFESKTFETNTYITETQLRAEVAKSMRLNDNFFDIEVAIDMRIKDLQKSKHNENTLIKVGDSYAKFSTIENEARAVFNMKDLNFNRMDGRNEKITVRDFNDNQKFKMNEGQINACQMITENKNLNIIIGDAGTGKTTSVIKFATQYNQENGRVVYGTSTQTITADELKDAGVDVALNTKKLILSFTDRATGEIINKGQRMTIIVDEAGMVGAEDYKKITEIAMVNRANLILVGDQKQLQSVSYGSTFEKIQEVLNKESADCIVRLSENMRQQNRPAKAIAEAYRDKDIETVFNTLQANNWLNVKDTKSEVIESLVDDYLADTNKSKIILCGTNKEIDLVNDACRSRLINIEAQKGKLNQSYTSHLDYQNQVSIEIKRPNTQATERNFCVGEDIVFLANSSKDKITNGDKATIQKITPNKNGSFDIVAKNQDDELVKFNSAKYNTFNHGIAISTHKSQGQTFDNCYHLASTNTTSNKSYVDGSRHKQQYKLYIQEDEINTYKKNAQEEQKKPTTFDLVRYNELKEIFKQQKEKEKAEVIEAIRRAVIQKEQEKQAEIEAAKRAVIQKELDELKLQPQKSSHQKMMDDIQAKEKAILEMKSQRPIAQPTQKKKGFSMTM